MQIKTGNPVWDGSQLDQKVMLDREGSSWVITFESRGGSGSNARNTQYAVALEAILARLSTANGVIDRALLASKTVADWSDEARLLPIPSGYPRRIRLNDVYELRRELCKAQSDDRFRAPGSRGSGTAWKRFELWVSLPAEVTAEKVTQLVFGE